MTEVKLNFGRGKVYFLGGGKGLYAPEEGRGGGNENIYNKL